MGAPTLANLCQALRNSADFVCANVTSESVLLSVTREFATRIHFAQLSRPKRSAQSKKIVQLPPPPLPVRPRLMVHPIPMLTRSDGLLTTAKSTLFVLRGLHL